MMTKILMSVKETANALNLGRTTVYAMINDGRLEAMHIGRRTLIKMESIHRLIDSS